MSTINYNYPSMQAAIDDSNRAVQAMQQVCEDIDAGYNKLASVHSGQTHTALLTKNHQASQHRHELLATFTALNQKAVQKILDTQTLDQQGANSLLA
jgi:uncharacterized protein YukE